MVGLLCSVLGWALGWGAMNRRKPVRRAATYGRFVEFGASDDPAVRYAGTQIGPDGKRHRIGSRVLDAAGKPRDAIRSPGGRGLHWLPQPAQPTLDSIYDLSGLPVRPNPTRVIREGDNARSRDYPRGYWWAKRAPLFIWRRWYRRRIDAMLSR